MKIIGFLISVVYVTLSGYGAVSAQGVPAQTLAPPLPGVGGRTAVSPDWLLANHDTAFVPAPSLAWLGHSGKLIYAVRGGEPATPKSIVETLDVATGTRHVLGEGWVPKPSTDGNRIAFIKSVPGEGNQLWVMNADGTDPRQLSHVSGGVGAPLFSLGYAFAWAPDSRRLAFSWNPPFVRLMERSAKDATQTTAIDADSPALKAVDSELWLYDVESGAGRRLLTAPARIKGLEWLRGGDELVYCALHFGYEYGGDLSETKLQTVRIESGERRTLANFAGTRVLLDPELAPDGSRLALTKDFDNGSFDLIPSVATMRLNSSENVPLRAVQLTHEAKFIGTQWSSDGRFIYARRIFGPYSQLYRIDPISGVLKQVTSESGQVSAFALEESGRLAVLVTDAHGRVTVSVAEPARGGGGELGPMREVAEVLAVPANIRLSEAREIEWQTPDGLTIRGLLFLPLDYKLGRRYPLIVDIHGGGLGSSLTLRGGSLLGDTPLELQMWTAKGYAVFRPDFRSTAAYGLSGLRKTAEQHHSWFRDDEIDIISGIDHLMDLGIVDGSRVALVGISGGATDINWLVATTRNRFRAAVSYEGFAEIYLQSSVSVGIGGNKQQTELLGGWAWDIPDRYLDNSAITHVRGATTPTLFLMGSPESGGGDPVLSVQFLYTALKRQGVDTRYIRYADEGHGVTRPANRRDVLLRAVEWIDSHMVANKALDKNNQAQQRPRGPVSRHRHGLSLGDR
jgi:dipeptidyl aminopeptidase/acylaminoacyl peptidase